MSPRGLGVRNVLLALSLLAAGCSSGGGGGGSFTASTAAPTTSGTTAPPTTSSSTSPTPSASTTLLGDPLAVARVKGREVRDVLGRQLLLRGINLSERSKKPPFAGWLEPKHVEHFVRLGFDHVRYLITWEAVEPQDGKFDDVYLAQVKAELAWFEARGIRVVVDMHQDQFARKYGGDGAPEWALLSPDPSPFVPDIIGPFPMNYVNPKVIANFDDFWTNPTKRARFARAWAHVVSKLKDVPCILGWEVLNEPFPGARLPYYFEENELSTFTAEVVAAIRAEDKERIVFFEPQLLAANLATCGLRPLADRNVVYAPHWYDPAVDIRAANGLAPFYDGDASRTAGAFTNLEGHAKKLDAPLWLGEWGIERRRSGADGYVADHQRLLDERLMSHAYWELNPVEDDLFTPIDPSGNDWPIAALLARPHPRAIAGTLTRLEFDATTRELRVEWTEGNLGPGAPTLIELPWKHYPANVQLLVGLSGPNARVEREAATGRLAVWADPSITKHVLTVRPR
jgi:endoglycosylceramidase